MVDEVDNKTSEPEESSGPAAGERLAAARRELNISVDEIAKELHLDEAKVRALERNEFDVLGAPVFAKGFLRQYARYVGLDPEEAVNFYVSACRSAEGEEEPVELPPEVKRKL